ncbi:MAG TPA: hypothetical protein VFH97_07135 [Gemmatimonadales bacterium]|nr:hypothetical protein [Gemmatimonadales bacterium]
MSRSLLGAGTLCLALITACGRHVTFVDPRAATDPADSTQDDSIVVRGDVDITVTIAADDFGDRAGLGIPRIGAGGGKARAGQQPGVSVRWVRRADLDIGYPSGALSVARTFSSTTVSAAAGVSLAGSYATLPNYPAMGPIYRQFVAPARCRATPPARPRSWGRSPPGIG